MSTVVSVNFSCKFVLATVVSVIAIRRTSHPSVVLETLMNEHRDVNRDLASLARSRSVGFVVHTDRNDPGIHGTVRLLRVEYAEVRTINGMCQSLSPGRKQTSYPSNCRGRSETECM